MVSARRRENSRRYVCLSGPDHRGCGKLTVVAPPLEQPVTDYALFRLDSPAVADAIAGRGSADDEASRLAGQLAEERETLDYLAEEFGARRIAASTSTILRASAQVRCPSFSSMALTQADLASPILRSRLSISPTGITSKR